MLQDHFARLHGNVGTGADGDACVRLGERRRVIDAGAGMT